jgi:hypothetical protein
MPDLDLIKQGEQGVRDWRGRVFEGPVGQSRGPAARLLPCYPRRQGKQIPCQAGRKPR